MPVIRTYSFGRFEKKFPKMNIATRSLYFLSSSPCLKICLCAKHFVILGRRICLQKK